MACAQVSSPGSRTGASSFGSNNLQRRVPAPVEHPASARSQNGRHDDAEALGKCLSDAFLCVTLGRESFAKRC